MGKTIILIAGTVVVINIVYLLLPNGHFQKFSKHVFGLILMLVFAEMVTKIDISSNILNFDTDVPVYNNERMKEILNDQTEAIVATKIKDYLTSEDVQVGDIYVTMSENEIVQIKITSDTPDAKRLKQMVSEYCEVEENLITVN